MAGPTVVSKNHLDALSVRENGGLLLSASSLTNRLWTGSMWYYEDPHTAPDTSKCSAGLDLETSLGAATDLKWVPGSSRLVAASDSGAVMLWEMEGEDTMSCLAQPTEHDDLVLSIDINADNTRVLSASQDSRVKVWDMEDFISLHTYQAHHASVWCVKSHPIEPTVFITCSQDGKVLLWDTRKNKPASVLNTTYLPSMTTCVAWQPGTGQTVAMGTETGSIALHDLKTNSVLCEASQVHSRQIHRMAFSPHSPAECLQLASASEDCTAAISEFSMQGGLAKLTATHHERRHRDFVRGVAWDPKTPRVYTCGWDGQVLTFEPSSKEGARITNQGAKQNLPMENQSGDL